MTALKRWLTRRSIQQRVLLVVALVGGVAAVWGSDANLGGKVFNGTFGIISTYVIVDILLALVEGAWSRWSARRSRAPGGDALRNDAGG